MDTTSNFIGQVPFGMKILVNDISCIYNDWAQYRFPKSKKVRIRKKWKKDHKNFRLEKRERFFKIGNDVLVVSSRVYKQLLQM